MAHVVMFTVHSHIILQQLSFSVSVLVGREEGNYIREPVINPAPATTKRSPLKRKLSNPE